jgi:hypothetical protein
MKFRAGSGSEFYLDLDPELIPDPDQTLTAGPGPSP